MRYCSVSLLLAASLLIGCQSDKRDEGVADGGSAVFAKGASTNDASFVATAGDRVFFEFDSSSLTHESQATLVRQVEWLMQNKKSKNVRVAVEGRCDERGTREYNLALGERRASSVRNFLVAHGVPARLITVVSYGKDKPIEVRGANSEDTKEEFWRQNRVSITVVE
ncbi:MAG: OmpA family protein [Holosporales bacterium]|jgi:peptidoglycan-associated lipoprotein|nr:OmpA family protein [Holosporales bacterium]